MGILASELDPYVHSNIYRFHGSLSDVTLDSTQGLRILKQEIAGIRTLATQLRAAAAQFSESNAVLNNRWETTPKRLEEVVREILESRTFLALLVKERKETSDILYQLINKNRVREIRGKIAEDHAIISMEEAVRAVLDTIPTELFLTDRGGQRAVLASRFNAKALDAAIEKRLVRQLNADSKVFERIILESLEEVVSEEKKRLKYQGGMEDAMDYFTRQMANKIFKSNQIWIYPVGGLEEYVARVTSDVRGIVARAISDAQLDVEEQRISSDVYSSGGSTALDVEFATGEGLSPEQMGKALRRALAEYSPPNRILLKGSDLEMRKGNDVVSIRNSTFEEEFMRRKVQDSPLVKALGSTNSYSRLMELIVSAPNAPLGRDDFANLSYIMANMIWFNTKGHISRGRKSMRAAERRGLTTSKGGLAYSHSLVMEILRESLASIIAFELSEDLEITPNKSAIFLLVRGRTIMSTYSMMEEVAKNLEAIVSRLESLDFTLYEGYSSRSAIEFYLSKSDAVRPDHLDPRRWYDDIRLTNVGRETGSQIIGTTQVRLGSNFSLMNALASSFIF